MIRGLALIYRPRTLWPFSGSERRFINVAKHLKRDYEVEFEAIESYPPLNFFLQTHHKACAVELSNNLYMNVIEWPLKGLLRILASRGKRFDFVYATNNNLYNVFLGLVASKLLSLPLIVVVHHLRWIDYSKHGRPFSFFGTYFSMRKRGLNQRDSLARTVLANFENILFKRADAIIAVSETIANQLIQVRYDKRVFLNGNGIDERYLNLNSREYPKKYDAVYVGRLDEGKGVLDLIRMWKEVVNSFHEAKLVIVGRGVFYDKIKSMIQSGGLGNNIQLFGYVEDEQLLSILASSRVFVTLSTVEGWGLAMGEALACGLPVICYGIPPLREVFGSCKNVTFVQPGNVERAAQEMARFLRREDRQLDEPEHLRAFLQRFSWREVARRERDAIRDVVK